MKSLKNKFYYAWCGLYSLISDHSIRIQFVFMIIAIILGILFRFTVSDMAILIVMCVIVVVSEAFNSVIEKIMDYIQPEYHNQVKIIKDMAAGVVLLASFGAMLIGLLLFGEKLLWMIF